MWNKRLYELEKTHDTFNAHKFINGICYTCGKGMDEFSSTSKYADFDFYMNNIWELAENKREMSYDLYTILKRIDEDRIKSIMSWVGTVHYLDSAVSNNIMDVINIKCGICFRKIITGILENVKIYTSLVRGFIAADKILGIDRYFIGNLKELDITNPIRLNENTIDMFEKNPNLYK